MSEPKTLFQLLGRGYAPATLSKATLLVIDAQESFRHRPYFDPSALPAWLSHQQALIDGARQRGLAVVQIFHIEDSGPFAEASGHVRVMAPLRIDPDHVIRKRRHGAFVGTDLQAWLLAHGMTRLLISGIRTEQCCETTARHGSDLDFEVDFVAEATLTFAMTSATGRRWSAGEIRERTELVLAGRFARIVTVAEALAGPLAQPAT